MRAASWHRLLLDVPTEGQGQGPRAWGPALLPPALLQGRGWAVSRRVRLLGAGAAQ